VLFTNEQSRRATVSLDFLELHSDPKAARWRAHRYSDGEWNKWVWKTDVKMDELEVTAATVLEIDMNRQVARPSCLSERSGRAARWH